MGEDEAELELELGSLWVHLRSRLGLRAEQMVWEQFMTLPAKRQANGKLILRGVGTSKALHEIKPGED